MPNVTRLTPMKKLRHLPLEVILLSSALFAACGGGTPAEPPASSTPAPATEQSPPPVGSAIRPPGQTVPAGTPEPTEPAQAPATSAASTPPAGAPAPLLPPKGPAERAASAPARPAFTRTDLRAGTGAEATTGKPLSVHYTGWLYDPSAPDQKGAQFDSSVGGAPFSFVLGAGMVIPGWDKGFDGMKVGGRRKLIIPPDLGYGERGAGGVIPPNATLIFEMELMGVGGY
jgi:FKBP-type peptidyl-prolyl cis-trans isomerase FkpA